VNQVLHGLLSAKDVGPGFQKVGIGTKAYLDQEPLMCSLSEAKLPGSPQIGERQYAATDKRIGFKYDKNYNQFIALYPDQQSAQQAFAALQTAAAKCPPKQHVPPMKDPTTNATLYAHDDTWTLSPQDTVDGWTHLHGWEREVNPIEGHVYNVYFDAYDFAVRGNLVLTTLYDERTDLKDTGEGTATRAKAVLEKQLQALNQS
jgi:hypothetical protein